MLYGVYECLDEAKKALSEISNKLRENEPLEIISGAEHANRIVLIPAHRVHYIVCSEVERPMDRRSLGPLGHYSPECLEGRFCELRIDGVLRSSCASLVLWSTYCSGAHTLP
jgi:hypothetical protein